MECEARLTVVIGARILPSDAARRRNLAVCLTALARQDLPRDRYRIVLVEQDAMPRLAVALTPLVDEYVFAHNAGAFNRAWGLNLGAATANAGVLCLLDADFVVPSSFLTRGLTAWECGTLAVRPYTELLYLDESSTQAAIDCVMAHRAIDAEDTRYQGELFRQSQGGCLWVDAEVYRRAGGHDERFEGWGREDREFWNRLSTLTPIVTLPGRLLHLQHSRSAEREPAVETNRRLFRDLETGARAPQTEMTASIGRYRAAALHAPRVEDVGAPARGPHSRGAARCVSKMTALSVGQEAGRQQAEILRARVQQRLNGPLRQLECREISFEREGLECAVFRSFSHQLGIDVAIKAPWSRFESHDSDPRVDTCSVLQQEASLLEHASRIGLPAPTVLTLFCSTRQDLLITTYVETDDTEADDRELGALLARLHAAGVPDFALIHEDGESFAATIAARVTRRCSVIGRLTGLDLRTPPADRLEEMIAAHARDSCLLHLNYRRANLLQHAHRVRGIVDWSNALRGDPALELARVAESGQLTSRFMEGYGLPDPLGQRDRPLQALFRLDAVAMLAIVFLSESPDPARALRFVARARHLAADVYAV